MDDVDRSLLRRISTGDQRAFEELYARHGQPLLAYAEGLLTDRGRAEEALQDTFLAAWRGAALARSDSSSRERSSPPPGYPPASTWRCTSRHG